MAYLEEYKRWLECDKVDEKTKAELKEIESTVLGASDRLIELEYEEFVKVREKVCAQIPERYEF